MLCLILHCIIIFSYEDLHTDYGTFMLTFLHDLNILHISLNQLYIKQTVKEGFKNKL